MGMVKCTMMLIFSGDAFTLSMSILSILMSLFIFICSGIFIYQVIVSKETACLISKHPKYFGTLIFTAILYPTPIPIYLTIQTLKINVAFELTSGNIIFSRKDINSFCPEIIQSQFEDTYTYLVSIFIINGVIIYLCANGIYLQRLTLIFQGSMFKISKTPKIIYIIYATITIICCIGLILTYPFDKYEYLRSLFIIVGMLFFLFESMYICCLLISKLKHFIKFFQNTNVNLTVSRPGSVNSTLSINNNINNSPNNTDIDTGNHSSPCSPRPVRLGPNNEHDCFNSVCWK